MPMHAHRRGAKDDLAMLLAWPVLDQVPRLLSQVDRNMHSPTYGCCARGHWHYRTEATGDSRLQAMGLTFALAWKLELPDNPYYRSPLLLDWLEGVLEYTLRIQRADGHFDGSGRGVDTTECTAFVAFQASEILIQLERHLSATIRNDVKGMLDRAAIYLEKATADSDGATTALAAGMFMNLAKLDSGLGYEDDLDRLLTSLEAVQSDEGWFPEADGADVGAASLAHSLLALIARRTGDNRANRMATRCASFLQHLLHRDGTAGGVYGSRNTEYVLPLGAILQAGKCEAAARIRLHLQHHLELGSHAIVTRCLDDYGLACLGPFYMLAAQAAREISVPAGAAPARHYGETYFAEAGLWLVETPSLKLVTNLKKGGVFHLDMEGHAYVDCGYFAEIPDGPIVTTQVLNASVDIVVDEGNARLSARLVVQRPAVLSPWKFVLSRLFRLLAPPILRRVVRARAQRRKAEQAIVVGSVHRNIVISEDAVDVTDFIEVNEPVIRMIAQLDTERASGVGATGYYQPQELNRDGGVLPVDLDAGKVVVQRRYDRDGMTVFSGE